MYLTQTAPFIIKPVDVRFDCSFSTKSGKFDHACFRIRFYFISKEYMKNIREHIIKPVILIVILYNVDIYCLKRSYIIIYLYYYYYYSIIIIIIII